MDKNFDFTQIGKRMPYSTPNDFFATMEANIIERAKGVCQEKQEKPTKTSNIRRYLLPICTSAAAIVAFFVVDSYFLSPQSATVSPSTNDIQAVEQAFCNMSVSDQAELLAIYQEDIFIND